MWVEPRGKSGVWRLLHWARDHKLEQAANTRREIRTEALSPVLHLGLWPVLPNATSLTAHACHPNPPEAALSHCPSVPGASHLLSQGLLGGKPGAQETGEGNDS